jgi:site-specific DNA recombinase
LIVTRHTAIYVRISKDREGAGLGVERQEQDCRELADRLGWDIVTVHTDNDISAYSGRPRPGYDALLRDLRSGYANAVIAWHPDRLHRRPTELETFIDLCETKSVAVQTVRAGEVDLGTPSGRAVARTVGAWARHEVEHSIARQRRAKAQAAAAGKFRGGRRPFGYEADGVTVRPDEAKIVQEVTQRVLVGESLNAVTRDLNDRGITTSTGRPWTYTEVRRLITRHRNAGLVEHHGQEVAEAKWPAIVDRDTWRAVCSMLADPTRRMPRTMGTDRFLGSGLFLCGLCDNTMLTATMQGSGRRRHPAYRCRGGPHLTRMATPVDELVSGIVIQRLSRPDARLLLCPDSPVDVPALQDQANTLRARLDELGALYAAGAIDGRQLSTATASLRKQLGDVDAELARAAAGNPLAEFADADDVTEAWEAAQVSRRKAVVRALMTVTLLKAPRGRQPGGGYFNPDYVRIEWKQDGTSTI